MGITSALFSILNEAKKQGFNFETICTIGKQNNYLKYKDLKNSQKKLLLNFDLKEFIDLKYVDEIFKKFLKADTVKSIDINNYENADIIHDLNKEIDKKFHNKFSTLIDSGSIEHLFDIKTVLENYSNLLKKNGSLFISTCANNSCGHGLYQFSPEFFLSVLNENNGFKIKNIYLEEYSFLGNTRIFSNLYKFKGKTDLSDRTILINNKPIDIIIHAIKIKNQINFNNVIQTDYIINKTNNNKVYTKLKNNIFKYSPNFLKILYEFFKYKKKYSLRNKLNFEKIRL